MPEEANTQAEIKPVQLNVSGRTLALITGGGILGGALVVLGFIMPSEFHSDPLGIGKLTGVARLWAPPEVKIDANSASGPLARESETPPRTDVIEVPLTDFLGGAKGSELEYKVAMKQGATVIYEWEVSGAKNPDDVAYDFHGHTTPGAGQPMNVATYKQARGLKQAGALTAPFDGIQGWQFSNFADGPVVIRIKLTGFYELVPAGKEGNLAGIVANVPAAQARPDFKPPQP